MQKPEEINLPASASVTILRFWLRPELYVRTIFIPRQQTTAGACRASQRLWALVDCDYEFDATPASLPWIRPLDIGPPDLSILESYR
jgi:hypothetical protein